MSTPWNLSVQTGPLGCRILTVAYVYVYIYTYAWLSIASMPWSASCTKTSLRLRVASVASVDAWFGPYPRSTHFGFTQGEGQRAQFMLGCDALGSNALVFVALNLVGRDNQARALPAMDGGVLALLPPRRRVTP